MGSYGIDGDRWVALVLNAGNPIWPSNGAGGAELASATGSEAVTWLHTCVSELVVTAAAATGTVVVCNAAGTALAGLTFPITAGMALPFPIPLNVNVVGLGGVSFKMTGTGNTATATYHRVQ